MAEKTMLGKVFKVGSLAAYTGLETKDANTLYFIKDKKMMFRGTQRLLGNFEVVSSTTDAKEEGIIYYIPQNGDNKAQLGYKNGSAFVSILSDATIDAIDARVATLETAVNTLNGSDTTTGSVAKQIKDAVESLDSSATVATVTDGVVKIFGITETDGKIEKNAAADVTLAKVASTGDAEDVAYGDSSNVKAELDKIEGDATTTGSIAKAVADAVSTLKGDASDNGDTLGELEDRIEGLEAAKVLMKEITGDALTALGTNVKEAYQLVDKNGDAITNSDTIKIYKDGSLIGAKLTSSDITVNDAANKDAFDAEVTGDPQYLSLCYQTEEGKYDIVSIDVSKFLSESEFGNGLQVDGGKVSVKNASETYLSVAESGISADVVKMANAKAAEGDVAEVTGLADALDVKTYVDSAVANKNVSAEGETGDSALVSASAANNEVTVASTKKLQDAVALAETSIQSVTKGTDGTYVATTVSTDASKNVTVGVAVTLADYDATIDAWGEANGLVEKSDLVAYVSDEVTKINSAAVNSVTKGTDGTYVSVTVDNTDAHKPKISVSDTIQAVASAGASAMGLAEASDVKSYVDNAIADLDVTEITVASVSAGVVTIMGGIKEDDGKIAKGSNVDVTLAKVATTGKAEDVAYTKGADSSLTSTDVNAALDELSKEIDDIDKAHVTVVQAETTQEVTVTASADSKTFTIGVNMATYTANADKGDDALSNDGLVTGEMVKNYVADYAIYWEEI